MGKRLFDIQFGLLGNDGARSSIWRVWAPTRADSLYCAPLNGSGSFKVSLHGEEHWRVAFNKEFESKMLESGTWINRSRCIAQWTAKSNLPFGLVLALRIYIPSKALLRRDTKPDDQATKWFVAPTENSFGEFALILGDSHYRYDGWPGQTGMQSQLVVDAELSFGRLWIVYAIQQMNESLQRRITETLSAVAAAPLFAFDETALLNLRSPRFIAGGSEVDGSEYLLELPQNRISLVRNLNT